MKSEIVIGRNPVLECLRAGKRTPHCLHLLAHAKGLEPILSLAKNIPVETKTREQLDRLAPSLLHQGVVLEADPLPVADGDRWAKVTEFGRDTLVVILDGVQDPQNFGAIVRTAVACGVTAVVFAKDRAAPLSPAAVKAAAGAMEYATLVQAVNLARMVDLLKERNVWVAALDAEAEDSIWEKDLTGALAIVVGSEGKGIRRLVRDRVDFSLRIPLNASIASLNASVAVGVALAECRRQRALNATR